MSMIEVLREKYDHVYRNDKEQMPFLLAFVASYCYKNNIDYDLVYNCADNPKEYIDLMVIRGYISYFEPWYYIWMVNGKERAFPLVPEIFSKGKRIIK